MTSPCAAVQAAKLYFAYRSGLRNLCCTDHLNQWFLLKKRRAKAPLVVSPLAPIIAAREAEAIGEYGHEYSHE
jgi:hypothetical protein